MAGPLESLTVVEVRARLSVATVETYPLWLGLMDKDPRRGVTELHAAARTRWRAWLRQAAADRPRWEREATLRRAGRWLLAGVDEAGRGPLAGPVVAAAVILPPGYNLPRLNDSKQVLPAARRRMYREIRKRALALSVGVVGPRLIDRINILRASLVAMRRAVAGLPFAPDCVLVDGKMRVPGLSLPQVALPGGDGLLASVSAASVVAKVYRDSLMARYSQVWPGYGFDRHRGYGTSEHMHALDRLGPCPIHRRSFLGGRQVGIDADVRAAEQTAVEYLERAGAHILDRGYRCRWGRVTAVIRDGEGTAVVEVRSGVTDLSPLRRLRLRRIAAAWAAGRGLDPARVRCDLVTVRPAAGPASAISHRRDVGGS